MSFDVEGAYLQGEYAAGQVVYARPPPGYRSFDRRGVPVVWRLTSPLYGEADAGRLWNQTFHKQMIVQKFTQSEADPCYYYKIYEDGTRLDICMYVDDGWVETDSGAPADADLALLAARFAMEFNANPTHFLGMNTTVTPASDGDYLDVSCQAYVEGMADKYLPDWQFKAAPKQPPAQRMRDAYERALLREVEPSPALVSSFGSKVGAMIYASPCGRPDIAQPVALLARALTFPTTELDALADETILYMAHTSTSSVRIDGSVEGGDVLTAQCDSDWSVGHSTTGFFCRLANIPLVYSSKRQPCIAMSSTEAEIIAASSCALEIIYVRTLLEEMGLPQKDPTPLGIDNKGAIELARDRKSCHRSRHVDRRFFKVRELEASGALKVEFVPTAANHADILTKGLPLAAFKEHRAALMSRVAVRGG